MDVAAGSLDGELVAQVVVEHGIVAFDDLASCVPCAVAAAAACLAVAETYFENVAVVSLADSISVADSSLDWKLVSVTVTPARRLMVDSGEGIDFELAAGSDAVVVHVAFELVVAVLVAAIFPFRSTVFVVERFADSKEALSEVVAAAAVVDNELGLAVAVGVRHFDSIDEVVDDVLVRFVELDSAAFATLLDVCLLRTVSFVVRQVYVYVLCSVF